MRARPQATLSRGWGGTKPEEPNGSGQRIGGATALSGINGINEFQEVSLLSVLCRLWMIPGPAWQEEDLLPGREKQLVRPLLCVLRSAYVARRAVGGALTAVGSNRSRMENPLQL